MNTFSDFRSLKDGNDEEMIKFRAEEIKDLIENNHKNAIDNIKNKQEKQIKNQNANHRITEEEIAIGTKVYVQVMGIHDKLHPRYRGPFFVKNITRMGNYILENSLKEEMSDTYPRQRLKIIGIEEESKEE